MVLSLLRPATPRGASNYMSICSCDELPSIIIRAAS